ncbi:MAG: vitamin K epoxide reductase family protein [Candidatus Binatia bacterium]
MAKAAKSKRSRADRSVPQAVRRQGPNWLLLILATAGIVLTAYLTYAAWREQLVAGCAVGDPCDLVLSSRWAVLFGMPTSFWGLLTYALLAAIAWNKPSPAQWKLAWIVTIMGLGYSLYLTGISFFVLEAFCPYCLISLALMAAIFGVVLYGRPADLPAVNWGPWLAKTGGMALVVVVALHLHYAGYWGKLPGPEDPWIRGLAEHLAKTDAKFYGASWCSHCQEQKESFGASASRVPYIECSPGGPKGASAPACTEAGIKSFPTWIINGQRYVGTQTLENLAQYSQYKGVNP